MSQRSRLRGPLDRRQGKQSENTDSILMRALLPARVITLKVIELQKSLLDS